MCESLLSAQCSVLSSPGGGSRVLKSQYAVMSDLFGNTEELIATKDMDTKFIYKD